MGRAPVSDGAHKKRGILRQMPAALAALLSDDLRHQHAGLARKLEPFSWMGYLDVKRDARAPGD